MNSDGLPSAVPVVRDTTGQSRFGVRTKVRMNQPEGALASRTLGCQNVSAGQGTRFSGAFVIGRWAREVTGNGTSFVR
jgi:hypothetical protein